MSETYVNLDNARTEQQKQVMDKIQEVGECPFCTKNLRKYHQRPIIKETPHWLFTENNYPYEGTKYHFLIITQEHAEKLGDISNEAGKDLWELLRWMEVEYKLESGAIGIRFGDIRFNGATVRHLHAHVVVGDVHNPKHQKIKFKMSEPA